MILTRRDHGRAQSESPTIGMVSVDTARPSQWLQYLLDALRENGYVAARDFALDDRTVNSARIAELAIHGKLPTVSPIPQFVEAAGLMSYGVDECDALHKRRDLH